jgi:hypothetical protein
MDMHHAITKNVEKRAHAFLMVSGLVLSAGIILPVQSVDLDCAPRDRLAKQLQAECSRSPAWLYRSHS